MEHAGDWATGGSLQARTESPNRLTEPTGVHPLQLPEHLLAFVGREVFQQSQGGRGDDDRLTELLCRQKIRETLDALSAALKVGVDNKDAISNIIIKLNELTTMLADNDQSVRDFSNRVTAMSGLLAEQAPGLQATLDQLNQFLANTSTTFGEHADELSASLTGLTNVSNQLRANSGAMVEIVDIVPLLMQNIDGAIDKEGRFVRLHGLIGTALSGEIVSVFCERVQMKSDGCRSGNMQDFGPDYGLTAALLGLTKVGP